MGANQSYEADVSDVTNTSPHNLERKARSHPDGDLHTGESLRKERQERQYGDGRQKKRKKAKPSAPHRPVVTSVTHNAVSLTWLPPRHTLHSIIAYTVQMSKTRQSGSKHWVTLTKNCQGTHFEARHLDSDMDYIFRVRAENIFGTGKPSTPSEVVTTKIFEMSSDLNCYISPLTSPLSPSSSSSSVFKERGVPKSFSYDGAMLDASDGVFDISSDTIGMMVKSPSLPTDSSSSCSSSSSSFIGGLNISSVSNAHQRHYQYTRSFKRRHSFNVHLDGRVSSILNNSDRIYSSSSLNSSTSTIVTNNNNSGSNNNNNNNNNNNSGSITNDKNSNDTDSVKSKHARLSRNNARRSSLQTGRKNSIPILLPGTGSNSINRLRESRNSLKFISSSDVTGIRSSISTLTSTPAIQRQQQRGSLNRNGKVKEFRNSLGSTASDSNTNTTSSTSSSSNSKEGCIKACEGSKLSLQSVLSDVTMSGHSQSSDDTTSSRPLSFLSDLGENSILGSFLNGSSMTDFSKFFDDDDDDNNGSFHNSNSICEVDNDKNKIKDDNYDKSLDKDNNDDGDDISKLKHNLKNMEITEEKLKFHDLKERLKIEMSDETCLNNNINQKDYYQTLGNPWERDANSVKSVSENIMAAPFSDDIKIALNAKNNVCDVTSNAYRSANQNWSVGGCNDGNDRDDFRTLRSVLQSNHLIVKQSRSMPEVVGVVLGEGGETRTLTRGKLTTIEDEDEEEETVRVTTL